MLVERLYPTPPARLPLSGLYLAHDLRARGAPGRPFIYSNFIASLDGRISEFDARAGRHIPPRSTRHPHDWHLYLELAAQADAVITSGRRLRELGAQSQPQLQCVADLARPEFAAWRRERGLPAYPACIVLSAGLDLPVETLRSRTHGEIIVLTGAGADGARRHALRAAGIEVVETAGPRVTGNDVHSLATARKYATVYSIAGPEVFYTLVASARLHRLYLTFALRLIGGADFHTLLRGDALVPPADLRLRELHLDPPRDDLPGLLYATLDRTD